MKVACDEHVLFTKRWNTVAGRVSALGPAGIDPLAALSRADEPEVRRQAVETLGLMTWGTVLDARDARRAATAVARAPRDKNERVRVAAFNYLGKLGPAGPEALSDLIEAAGDTRPGVRAAAVKCLGEMGPAARKPFPCWLDCSTSTACATPP